MDELRGRPLGRTPPPAVHLYKVNENEKLKQAKRYVHMFIKVTWSPSGHGRDIRESHGQVTFVGKEDDYVHPVLRLERWMKVARQWRNMGVTIRIPIHTIEMIEVWSPGPGSASRYRPPRRPV